MKILRTFFFFFMLFFSTILISLATIITSYLTQSHDKAHIMGRLYAKVNLWGAGVKVIVKGLENLDLKGTYVYAPNHQSWFDIFALMGELPVQFRWLAKEELFKIPFLGPAMASVGHIPIDRSDRRKAFASMNVAADRIRNGTSVIVFPEGTRSPDGVLQSFKAGGFILAMKSQQPIVPISISGSSKVIAKSGNWLINPGVVRITIEPPIETKGMKSNDREKLIKDVREAIKKNLTQSEGGYLHDHPFYN